VEPIEIFEKYRFSLPTVIPAETGIQCFQGVLDSGFRRLGDRKGRFSKVSTSLVSPCISAFLLCRKTLKIKT